MKWRFWLTAALFAFAFAAAPARADDALRFRILSESVQQIAVAQAVGARCKSLNEAQGFILSLSFSYSIAQLRSVWGPPAVEEAFGQALAARDASEAIACSDETRAQLQNIADQEFTAWMTSAKDALAFEQANGWAAGVTNLGVHRAAIDALVPTRTQMPATADMMSLLCAQRAAQRPAAAPACPLQSKAQMRQIGVANAWLAGVEMLSTFYVSFRNGKPVPWADHKFTKYQLMRYVPEDKITDRMKQAKSIVCLPGDLVVFPVLNFESEELVRFGDFTPVGAVRIDVSVGRGFWLTAANEAAIAAGVGEPGGKISRGKFENLPPLVEMPPSSGAFFNCSR